MKAGQWVCSREESSAVHKQSITVITTLGCRQLSGHTDTRTELTLEFSGQGTGLMISGSADEHTPDNDQLCIQLYMELLYKALD